jgi:hypothetical protein
MRPGNWRREGGDEPHKPLDKMSAIARRDLLTAVRYRTGFLTTAAGALAELAAFY